MKKIQLIIAVTLFCFNVYSQTESTILFSNKNGKNNDTITTLFHNINSHGGYIAFTIEHLDLDDFDGIKLGGRGTWVINHSFSCGFGGYGFFSERALNPQIDTLNYEYRIEGGYGGLLIEPIIAPKCPVHVSFPILIGAGGIVYSRQIVDEWVLENNENQYREQTAFFIIEPGIELELNLLKFLRFSFGAYYRHTSDIDMKQYGLDGQKITLMKDGVLNNISYGIAIKFGKF